MFYYFAEIVIETSEVILVYNGSYMPVVNVW